jgi:hypothetical protein
VEVAVPFAAGVTEVKLNPQVTEAFTGTVAQVSATEALNPLMDVTVIVDVVELPATVVAVVGDALKPKSFTVSANVAVRF